MYDFFIFFNPSLARWAEAGDFLNVVLFSISGLSNDSERTLAHAV